VPYKEQYLQHHNGLETGENFSIQIVAENSLKMVQICEKGVLLYKISEIKSKNCNFRGKKPILRVDERGKVDLRF